MATNINSNLEEVRSSAGFAFSEPLPAPEPTYAEWFRENILRSRWLTYLVAFYLHVVALLALAVIYLHAPLDISPIIINAVMSDSEPIESSAIEIFTTEAEVTPTEPANETPEVLAMSASTMIPMLDENALDSLPDALAAMATSHSGPAEPAKSVAKPQAQAVAVKAPRNAVSAGSFSVWTEPDNPDPGEPYKIIVQIRMPDGTERYSLADLEGVVVGSDGYQKMIPGNLRGFLPVQDGHVRFEVHIVSADENVQDTVFVRSKVLREAQKLQLRF